MGSGASRQGPAPAAPSCLCVPLQNNGLYAMQSAELQQMVVAAENITIPYASVIVMSANPITGATVREPALPSPALLWQPI